MSESSPFRTQKNSHYRWPPEPFGTDEEAVKYERVTHVIGAGEPKPWMRNYIMAKQSELLVARAGDIMKYLVTGPYEAPEQFSLDQEWWNQELDNAHQQQFDAEHLREQYKAGNAPELTKLPGKHYGLSTLLKLTPPQKFIKYFRIAADLHRDDASAKGTYVHKVAEELAQGNRIDYNPALEDYVQNAKRFLNRYSPRFLEIESVVYSDRYGYAGQFDWLAKIPVEVMLTKSVYNAETKTYQPWTDKRDKDAEVYDKNFITVWGDWKTTVKDDLALQLSAYYYADFIGRADGTKGDMPYCDEFWGVQFGSKGFAVVPVTVNDQVFKDFLSVQQVSLWMQERRKTALNKPLLEEAL